MKIIDYLYYTIYCLFTAGKKKLQLSDHRVILSVFESSTALYILGVLAFSKLFRLSSGKKQITVLILFFAIDFLLTRYWLTNKRNERMVAEYRIKREEYLNNDATFGCLYLIFAPIFTIGGAYLLVKLHWFSL